MAKEKIQTIKDIAELANVSKSTVSRALNNSSLVKEETKERIQAIARKYRFRINEPARNLSTRKSHTIGFVTHAHHVRNYSMEDLFSLEIMGGIANGLHEVGYEMLVAHVDPRDSGWAHQYLDSGRVDGFILMTATRKKYHIKALVEMKAPFIVWGIPHEKYRYCTVTGDNVSGGQLATKHLISKSRKRIAFLGGAIEELEVHDRFKGYEMALNDAGMKVHQDLIAYGDFSFKSGISAMEQLLKQAPDLDAVFVNSDLMALGAIKVLQNYGKQVPGDIAVVGYDDLSIASYNNLPLTTVRQNIPLAGRLLAQNLIQHIETGVITNVTLPVELIIRKSA